jgi:hypothetical protein
MKYNEKMVLISEKTYRELMKKCNEDKSNEKICNLSDEEEKKEEKIKKDVKFKDESKNFKQEEKEKKEIESIEEEEKDEDEGYNNLNDLPLNPSDFFSSDSLTKKSQGSGSRNKKVSAEEWQRHKKKQRSGRRKTETGIKKKTKKLKWIHLK